MNIFGVQIQPVTREALRIRIAAALGRAEKTLHIVTANPEMLVVARKKPRMQECMNEGLVVCDGAGLAWVGNVLHNTPLPRITGSQALNDLAALVAKQSGTLVLLGGDGNDAEGAARHLEQTYPGLRCVGIQGGEMYMSDEGGWVMDAGVMDEIRSYQPVALAVALGHEKQEYWIHDQCPRLPSVRVAIGVGGVFAFLSGRIVRAPKPLQNAGLEWVWRLLQEPSRIGRICTATIIFPILAFWDRIRG